MTGRRPVRERSRRLAASLAALALMAMVTGGCARPPDEAWLRFLGFQDEGATLAIFEGDLLDGTTDSVDALFENDSGVGSDGGGTGLFVERARVEYRMEGFSPPAFDYLVSLYLPAAKEATPATLSGLPLAPAALKRWLLDTGAFNDAGAVPSIALQARVTFFAIADNGTRLDTTGGISVVLDNSE